MTATDDYRGCVHVYCVTRRHPDETYCQLLEGVEPQLPNYLVDRLGQVWHLNYPASRVWWRQDVTAPHGYRFITWNQVLSGRMDDNWPGGEWTGVMEPWNLPKKKADA